MSSTGDVPTGVVCDDRPAVRRTVTSLLTRCGLTLTGEVGHFHDLRDLVLRTSPTIAVVTLPTPGMNGLSAVAALRAEAPGTEIVVLSPFATLALAAREAGALALVTEDDPQALQVVLLAISERQQAAGAVPAACVYDEPIRDRPGSSAVV